MDFLDIIITVAILLAGGLMTGGKKKPVKQSRQTPAGMNTPTDNMPRGFLFDEDDDIDLRMPALPVIRDGGEDHRNQDEDTEG